MKTPEINTRRLWSRLMDMAEIGEIAGNGSCRLALSQDDADGRALLLAWGANRGYAPRMDQIGNLFLRRAGADDTAPALVLGSHLDTQPNGGRFDGVLGVLAGLEVLETLDDLGIKTRVPIDLAVWTNEEGARVLMPAMMGSGVHCGLLSLPDILATSDDQGVTVAAELAARGYDSALSPGQARIAHYAELHIEQGPVLGDAGKTIGVVTGGQGIRWFNVTLTGTEAHAGPLPMDRRRDPVAMLARVIDLAFQVGRQDADARATIGKIEVSPSSINVVPGKVALTIDLRHPDEAVLDRMQDMLLNGLQQLSGPIAVEAACIWQSPVIRFDPEMVAAVRDAAGRRGYEAMDIVSGAGHDAFNLARIVPTTMIFVPSQGGISHNPAEYTAPVDVAAGANVLLDMAIRFAGATSG